MCREIFGVNIIAVEIKFIDDIVSDFTYTYNTSCAVSIVFVK